LIPGGKAIKILSRGNQVIARIRAELFPLPGERQGKSCELDLLPTVAHIGAVWAQPPAIEGIRQVLDREPLLEHPEPEVPVLGVAERGTVGAHIVEGLAWKIHE
jgi:hypothetical protein